MSAEDKHIYIHVPFCSGKCAYCSLYSVHYGRELADKFLVALAKELSRTVNSKSTPETIYCGGGTPTILADDQLEILLKTVREHVSMDNLKEWTFEAAPGTLSKGKLKLMQDAGVNRISIGAQSFDDDVLKQMGRRHNSADICETVELARAEGISNVGVDLIACLPGVDKVKWRESLVKVAELDLKHVSVYALTIEEGSKLKDIVESGDLEEPQEEQLLNALDVAEEVLGQSGFERYEISNYALSGCGCAHNVSCWRGEDYFGFGPSASSRAGLKRWTNNPCVHNYISGLSEHADPPREMEEVSKETDSVERLMFGLRLKEGVVPEEFADGGQGEHWVAVLDELKGRGLAEFADGRWRLTAEGRDMADMVAEALIR